MTSYPSRFFIVLTVMLLSLGGSFVAHAAPPPPPEEIQKTLTTFFNLLKQNKIDEAFDGLGDLRESIIPEFYAEIPELQ